MALKIKWSRRASATFLKTVGYLEQEWGMKSAREFVGRTHFTMETLSNFPELGKFVLAERNIRSFVLVKQITVFYKIQGNSIILLHFFNTLQNPNKRL